MNSSDPKKLCKVISDRYFNSTVNTVALKNAEDKLDKAIKEYKKLIKVGKKSCIDKMANVTEQIKANYDKAYKEFQNISTGRNPNIIYLFIDKSRDKLSSSTINYSGFSYVGCDFAFIFNDVIKNNQHGIIAHEIGHVLGLDHVFNKSKYNEIIETKAKLTSLPIVLKDLKVQKDSLLGLKMREQEKMNKKGGVSKTISNKQTQKAEEKSFDSKLAPVRNNFNKFFAQLKTLTSEAKQRKGHDIDKYYYDVNKRFESLNGQYQVEVGATSSPTTNIIKTKMDEIDDLIKQKDKEIKKKSSDIIANTNKLKQFQKEHIVQYASKSIENFMDYPPEEEKKSSTNNFQYRSFFAFQWFKMLKSNKLIKHT